MHIILVDRNRNVRIAPTKAAASDDNPFDVLRSLMRGHAVDNGQIVFECDQEFYNTLSSHASESDFALADKSERKEPIGPNMALVPVPTFAGVPILVQGEA